MRPWAAVYLSSSDIREGFDTSMAMPSKPLGDFLKHDFRGAATDCLYAGVSCHSLDGAFAHEAHPAMKLHAIVHHGIDQFAAIGLHHRDFAGHIVALRVAPGGGIDELTAGFHFGCAHRDALPDCLLVP